MPGLISGDCSADNRSLRTPRFTDRLVGGGRRWLMLLSELYSDYTASARRVWLNIKQRHYVGERGERRNRAKAHETRNARGGRWGIRWRRLRARVEEHGVERARREKDSLSSSPGRLDRGRSCPPTSRGLACNSSRSAPRRYLAEAG